MEYLKPEAPGDTCFTPEQFAVRALVDSMDDYFPWIFDTPDSTEVERE